MGGSPPPYIAFKGWIFVLAFGVVPSGTGVGDAMGVCRRKMGLIGPSRGSADPRVWPTAL